MYEQFAKRENIISAVDDLFFTLEDNFSFIISVLDCLLTGEHGDGDRHKNMLT